MSAYYYVFREDNHIPDVDRRHKSHTGRRPHSGSLCLQERVVVQKAVGYCPQVDALIDQLYNMKHFPFPYFRNASNVTVFP